jgi:hypothetical protein
LILGSLSLAGPSAIAQTTSASSRESSSYQFPYALKPAPKPAPSLLANSLFPTPIFEDVSPTHWAYPAVNNLAVEYGCISGYPDGTLRGDALMTRYEFAAALDGCLGNFVQIIQQGQQSEVDALIQELANLEAELGTLSEEVDQQTPVPQD